MAESSITIRDNKLVNLNKIKWLRNQIVRYFYFIYLTLFCQFSTKTKPIMISKYIYEITLCDCSKFLHLPSVQPDLIDLND